MSDLAYFDDMEIGTIDEWGDYELTETEIVEMATRFDPQPWHLDHDAAQQSVFGELVACACHLSCVMSWLHTHNPRQLALAAGLGQKEHRLRSPGRVGDVLRLRTEVLATRPSGSRPTMGIVEMRNTMLASGDRVVLDNVGVVLVHRRP